jgi:regulator of sigma E protease
LEYVVPFLQYVIGFVVLLAILIFVHEFGHFIVAKLLGVKVLKFSLGFPPAILKRKWGETEYAWGATPLGGYVKLLGEDPESDEEIPPEELPRAFTSKPLWVRMAVIVAGPLSNYLLAVVLLCVGYMAGWPVLSSEIGKVFENTPAMAAGFQTGDVVKAIDGRPVTRWDGMKSVIEQNAGKSLTFTVERKGQEMTLTVPSVGQQKDMFGDTQGMIGVSPSGKSEKLSFGASIKEGVIFSGYLTKTVVLTLYKLVRLEISPKALSGPITILQASGESVKTGPLSFIFLLSFISINLAIINLLPIPILDGGHLFFFIIEAIIGKPVTGRIREVAVQLGLVFIIFLVALAFYNDIYRIATKGWTLAP